MNGWPWEAIAAVAIAAAAYVGGAYRKKIASEYKNEATLKSASAAHARLDTLEETLKQRRSEFEGKLDALEKTLSDARAENAAAIAELKSEMVRHDHLTAMSAQICARMDRLYELLATSGGRRRTD